MDRIEKLTKILDPISSIFCSIAVFSAIGKAFGLF